MLNFTKDDMLTDDVVVDIDPEGPEAEVTQEEKEKFEKNVIFGIEEHPDIDAIEIFPMRPTLILHGELEVKILIETLKKYLHE